MNLGDMVDRLLATVGDTELSMDEIVALFNEAVKGVAEQVCLPSLDSFSSVSVQAGASNATLPNGFMRDVHTVINAARYDKKIDIVSSRKALVSLLQDGMQKEGDIEFCCEEGGVLYFVPTPLEDTELSVGYYKYPELLSSSEDSVSCIPSFYHENILVSYVAHKLFFLAEADEDQGKVNSDKYLNRYVQYVSMLAQAYPDTSKKKIRRLGRMHYF